MEQHDDAAQLAAAMMDAARAGATERLQPLLDQGVPLDMQDPSGNTMLMLAAYHGHPQLVAALLEAGANPDVPNDRGQSPLAGAAFKGHVEVARLLLAGGADPESGAPSARETAEYFAREEISALM